ELHGFHGLCRLERQPAGIESDAFTDQGNFLSRLAGWLVANDDEPRLFLAASIDRQQARQLHGLDFFLSPDFDRQAATAAMALRLCPKKAGGGDCLRLVAELTCQEHSRDRRLRP